MGDEDGGGPACEEGRSASRKTSSGRSARSGFGRRAATGSAIPAAETSAGAVVSTTSTVMTVPPPKFPSYFRQLARGQGRRPVTVEWLSRLWRGSRPPAGDERSTSCADTALSTRERRSSAGSTAPADQLLNNRPQIRTMPPKPDRPRVSRHSPQSLADIHKSAVGVAFP